MRIDSYRFLPRSFRQTFEEWTPIADTSPVWTDFAPRLADARVALLSSGGLYLEGEQEPFDLEREKREPNWGDPTFRELPHELDAVRAAHLHINTRDAEDDHEVVLPTGILQRLVDAGVVGGATERHFSVMGFQGREDGSLDAWRTTTAPAIAASLRGMGGDGVVLAPV